MNEDLKKEPLNILVVDDEEAIRYTYDLALSDAGYTVFYAEGGAGKGSGILLKSKNSK